MDRVFVSNITAGTNERFEFRLYLLFLDINISIGLYGKFVVKFVLWGHAIAQLLRTYYNNNIIT